MGSARVLVPASVPTVIGAASALGLVFTDDSRARWLVAPALMLVLASGTVALLILRRHPRHPIGWLLAVHPFFLAFGMTTPPVPADASATRVVTQLTSGAWVFLYICLVLIGYLFPDGRFLSPRWRRWVWTCVGGYAAFLVGAATSLDDYQLAYPGEQPPLPLPPLWVSEVLGLGGLALVAASLVGTVVCARQRLRRATGDERVRLLWFAWAATSIPAMLATCWVDYLLTGRAGVLTVLGITGFGSVIPVVIGIAILRHRLFDIELVLSRTLTYGTLTMGVVGAYALALWAAEGLLDNRSAAGLLGVALVAVAVQPAHAFLRRRVERWVYGDRSDPGAALRRLSDRVEHAADTDRVLESVTESVADALKLKRVWVELARDRTVAAPGDHVVRLPLVHRGERLGDLAVDVPADRRLSAADLALLHDLTRHAAVVVAAVQLAEDLRASRARLVTAREEERRRLRRDLHDGLGPSLAAIVLKLGAAQSRAGDTERNHLLAEAREETRAAIAEVRRLVDDLRPPAIDEVGLLGAIRHRAATLSQASGLEVEVAGPAAVPVLPAAVEVAAYRIATEALTNVIRHSDATSCRVRIAVQGAFELTVTDNGHGAAPGSSPGVGWTSMTERAAELGGSCTITSRPEGGLVVRAVLPLPSAAETAMEPAP